MITPKYLSLGLKLGICGPQDVQEWVNIEIEKTEIPSKQLIDLAYTKDSDAMSLYSLLQDIPDSSDTFENLRSLLSNITDENLKSISYCHRLAECLYNIWVENDYEAPDDLSLIGSLDDGYALAKQGIAGTIEGWHEDFRNFVTSFRKTC